MGRVYTFHEIKDGKIPKPADFLNAKKELYTFLDTLYTRGLITGGKMFGSVAIDKAGPRSDLDVVIIGSPGTIFEIIGHTCAEIYTKHSVGVEPILIDPYLGEQGLHPLDYFFLESVKNIPSDGNLVGIDPGKLLRVPELTVFQTHTSYLTQKLRRFSRANLDLYGNPPFDRNKELQRALEAPISIGRRSLQVLDCMGITGTLTTDSKISVINQFLQETALSELHSGFVGLLSLDAQYTQLLEDQLHKPVAAEYEEALCNLYSRAIPAAFEWTLAVCKQYQESMEGKLVETQPLADYSI